MGKQMIPDNAKAMMEHFGEDAFKLNAHEKNFIQQFAFRNEYLFIETKDQRDNQRGWCSYCRKWHTFPQYDPFELAHNERIECPFCGAKLIIKHSWRMSGKLFDEGLVYLYRPSVCNPEVVTARTVVVRRFWGDALPRPTKMKMDVRYDSFYVYEYGKGGKMLKPINNQRIYWAEATAKEFSCPVYQLAKKPNRRDAAYICKSGGGGYREWVQIAEDTPGAFEAAKNSPLRYGMEEYYPYERDRFLVYWHWAAKYSSVEKLVKMGLAFMVSEKMMGQYGSAINWKGKDLTSILRGRLTKEDKAFMRKHGNEIGDSHLQCWQLFEGRMNLKQIFNAKTSQGTRLWGWYLSYWRRIKRIADIFRVMKYLVKQDRTPDLYADYIEECEKLGYDLKDKAVLFPKDLQRAHEHTMKQIVYQKEQAIEEEYAKKRRPAMRKKYEWAAMGMIVVVPEHVSDLIVEGEKQHNCVGGYMERVAKGQTDVVFIRRDEAPEKSYITMEIHDGKIIQARTKNNGPLDALGKKFVEAFRLAKLEKKKARKSA